MGSVSSCVSGIIVKAAFEWDPNAIIQKSSAMLIKWYSQTFVDRAVLQSPLKCCPCDKVYFVGKNVNKMADAAQESMHAHKSKAKR